MEHNFEDDLILWDSFRSGDKEAYTYIYQKYVYHLLSYGLQFTTDRELVKDCVQDVFIKLYTYRTSIVPNKIKIYLLICMKNQMVTLLSQRQNHNDSINSIGEEIVDISDKPYEEQFIQDESSLILKSQIKSALAQLSLHQREIIHYRFMDELTMEQISELMEMNIQSTYNLLHRAIKKMREILKKDSF